MTTVVDLIADTQRQLYGMHRGEYNSLAATIGTSDTSLTFTYDMKGLVAGAIISIEDELMYVWSTSTATKTAVVQRAWLGTTAATHTSAVVVEVAPRFPKDAIRDALLAELRSWGRRIYQVSSTTVAASTTTNAYDLPIGTFYDVLDVRRSDSADARWRRIKYEVVRSANTSSFASGYALQLQEDMPTSVTLQVVYSKPLTLSTFTDAIDTSATIGIPDSALDVPPLGAAWRLLAPREIRRTFTESKGEERDNRESPAGHATQTAASLKRLRDQRLDEEAAALQALHAWRF